jgi:hypothetical protein
MIHVDSAKLADNSDDGLCEFETGEGNVFMGRQGKP